jgi:phosphoenolpyruvate carboxylase
LIPFLRAHLSHPTHHSPPSTHPARCRFGLPVCALRSLATYDSAVLLSTLDPPPAAAPPAWRAAMDAMAAASCDAYRAVVFQDARFPAYFAAATPQGELGALNIGSRPAKRPSGAAGADVSALRAIPWIFAWTQTRMMLPAWLGAAEGVAAATAAGGAAQMREMYESWPFFSSLVDLIEMVLAKVRA